MDEYNFKLNNLKYNNLNLLNITKRKALLEQNQTKSASTDGINDIKEILKNSKTESKKTFFRDLTDEEIEERLNEIQTKNNPLNKIKEAIWGKKSKTDTATSEELVPHIGTIDDNSELYEEDIITQNNVNPIENTKSKKSITLEDSQGMQTISLSASEELNLLVLQGQKTFTYTIKATTAQNITLQVQEGYLLLNGSNLSVQTGDEQYSNIAIIGESNNLKIGTRGKTYNVNNISYQSAEGGHSVYTWGDSQQSEPDLTLSRGQTGSISATAEAKTVLITNPFNGENYIYTVKTRQEIKSMEGYNPNNTFLDSQEVEFKFLANGRLVITANYVDIKAESGQQDDIILLGHFNNLDTGDENDIVRVGYAIDSKGSYVVKAASYDEVGNATSEFKSFKNGHGRAATSTIWADCAVGNHIKTGSGDDHVTMMLYKYDNTTTIDTGDGFDTFMTANGTSAHDANGHYFKFSESTLASNNKITGVEQAGSRYEVDKTFVSGTSTYDGNDGWCRQGGSGDCRFFALMNSLFQFGRYHISDFVDIDSTSNPNYFKVTFKNYNPQDWVDTTTENRTNTINLKKTDVYAYLGAAGDLDSVVVDMALNKLLEINQDRGKTTVYTAHWNTISRYIYGNELFSFYTPSQLTQSKFIEIWNKYQNNEINNLTLSLNGDEDTSLGKVGLHAYTIRDLKLSNTGEIIYMELVNPWDDRDCVRYDWETFKSSGFEPYMYIFGYSIDGRAPMIYEN